MKKFLNCLVIGSFLLFSGSAMAKEMQSTGTGDVHQSDDLAVGDPYAGKTVSAGAEAGPANTQAPYTENCKEARCIRAKQRQQSSPYWKGHHKGQPNPAATSTTTTPAQ